MDYTPGTVVLDLNLNTLFLLVRCLRYCSSPDVASVFAGDPWGDVSSLCDLFGRKRVCFSVTPDCLRFLVRCLTHCSSPGVSPVFDCYPWGDVSALSDYFTDMYVDYVSNVAEVNFDEN